MLIKYLLEFIGLFNNTTQPTVLYVYVIHLFLFAGNKNNLHSASESPLQMGPDAQKRFIPCM